MKDTTTKSTTNAVSIAFIAIGTTLAAAAHAGTTVPTFPENPATVKGYAMDLRGDANALREASTANKHLPKPRLTSALSHAKIASAADKNISSWVSSLDSTAASAWYKCMGPSHGSVGAVGLSLRNLMAGEKPKDAYPGIAQEADEAAAWLESFVRCYGEPQNAVNRKEEKARLEAQRAEREAQVAKQREQLEARKEEQRERLAEQRKQMETQLEAKRSEQRRREKEVMSDLSRKLQHIEQQKQTINNGIQQIGDIILQQLERRRREGEIAALKEEQREAEREMREERAQMQREMRAAEERMQREMERAEERIQRQQLSAASPIDNDAPTPTPMAAAAKVCPYGQRDDGAAAGHCCWPGQAWDTVMSACAGAPTTCPATMVVRGAACEYEVPLNNVRVPLTRETTLAFLANALPHNTADENRVIADKFWGNTTQSFLMTIRSPTAHRFVLLDAHKGVRTGSIFAMSAQGFGVIPEFVLSLWGPVGVFDLPIPQTNRWFAAIADKLAATGSAHAAIAYDNGNALAIELSIPRDTPNIIKASTRYLKPGEWQPSSFDPILSGSTEVITFNQANILHNR